MTKAWKLWTVVICVTLLLVVVVVVLGPVIFKNPKTTVASELNFAAILATVLGGVMAAAGLIITLVSVVSFSTLDTRIEDKFNRLVEQNEQDQRSKTNRLFQGFALQLQSINSIDLYQAERLTEQALTLYPELPGSRRQLALRFFDVTETTLVSKFLSQTTFHVPHSNDGSMAVLNHAISCQNFKPAPSGTYAAEAEKWLERARVHGEDEDRYLTFCLAKLYGIRGRYDLMMEALEQSVNHVEDLPSRVPGIIMSCANACATEQHIWELGKRIGRTLPVSQEDFFQVVNEKGSMNSPTFLCRRSSTGMHLYRLPDMFRLRVFTNGEAGYRLSFFGDNAHDVLRAPSDPNSEQWYTEEQAWSIITNEGWVLGEL